MTISIATTTDAEGIGALIPQLGYNASQSETRARLKEILNEPHSNGLFVARLDLRIVGWVHVHVVRYLEVEPYGQIGGLVVDEQARHMGIGRALMNAAETWARDRGLGVIRLRTGEERTTAHQFYRKLGYEVLKKQLLFAKMLDPH